MENLFRKSSKRAVCKYCGEEFEQFSRKIVPVCTKYKCSTQRALEIQQAQYNREKERKERQTSA